MSVDDILAAVGELTEFEDLWTIRRAIEDRAKRLRSAKHQRAVTERWAKLERCKPGTVLYVGGRSTVRIGSLLQTGDSVKVLSVDRERERLRVRLHRVGGKLKRKVDAYILAPHDCERFELSRTKPETNVDKMDRAMARKLAEVFK